MITRKDIIHPNKLRILAKVIELNSVTQAAKSLSITQPAVSHALHSLENHFSTPLIKKNGNTITITPAAKILSNYWNQFSSLYENMYKEASSTKNMTVIKIAMISTAHHFIPKQLHALKSKYPQYQFVYHILSATESIDAIKRGEYDIAILTNPPSDHQVKSIHLKKHLLQWVASSHSQWVNNETVTFDQICQHPIIIRQRDRLMTQSLLSYFNKHQAEPNIQYEIDNTEAIKTAVIDNLGLALLPKDAVQTEINDGKLIALELDNFTDDQDIHWYITQSNQTTHNQDISDIIKHLIKKNTS